MPKIKYGLKKVHYSIVTETTNASTGEVTSSYGTVKPWPGAVNMNLDAQGEDTPFYADDGVYEMLTSNNGYQGDFECALIPEDVYVSALGQEKDANGVVIETSNDVKKYIALMFEFQLDKSGRRYLFYRCSLTRPSVASQTNGDTVNPQTDTITITVTPRPDDDKVKAYVDKGSAAYNGWYTQVYAGGASVPMIDIQPQSITLDDGESVDLQVKVVPADAVITWDSSDLTVASVSNGTVLAAGAGTAIITASIEVDNVTYTSTVTVIVNE